MKSKIKEMILTSTLSALSLTVAAGCYIAAIVRDEAFAEEGEASGEVGIVAELAEDEITSNEKETETEEEVIYLPEAVIAIRDIGNAAESAVTGFVSENGKTEESDETATDAAPEEAESSESAISVFATGKLNEDGVRYSLTDAERAEVCGVVMAECGAEPYEGIIAVTQCILNACEDSGLRPHIAIPKYGYTPVRKYPNELVEKAVSAVFDDGYAVTDEHILYFYAPYGNGGWHETQKFVFEIGGHRFFAPHD